MSTTLYNTWSNTRSITGTIPCTLDAQGNEVCPPTDEPTPAPGPPTPQCPEAGPDVCDGETSPPEEVPPDSDDDTIGNGNDNGNGEDRSNGDEDDNESGEEGSSPVPPFG